MRKLLVVPLFFSFLFASSQVSQDQINLEKYWNYREVLRNQFMYEGNNPEHEQGTMLVASKMGVHECIDYVGETYLKYSDQTLDLGHYLAVLALEYRLLNGSGEDKTQTLIDIDNVLATIERLDEFAEPCFTDNNGNPGIPEVNGFFIRDDIPSGFDQNFQFEEYEPYEDINYVYSDYIEVCETGANTGNEISQDQVWGLFLGLRLTKHLVLESDVQQKVKDITHRIINAMHYVGDFHCIWTIKNPVTGIRVKSGWDVNGFNWAFAEIAHDITGQNEHCGGSYTSKAIFEGSQVTIHNNWPSNKTCFNDVEFGEHTAFNTYGICILTAISNHTGGGLFGPNAYEWLVNFNDYTKGYFDMENGLFPHLIAINQAIYGYDGDKLKNAEFYESFINSSPPCGAYHYLDSEGNHINTEPPWHTVSLSSPWHCRATDHENRGHFNMIDFMLIYNAYFLNYKEAGKAYVKFCDPIYSHYPNHIISARYELDICSKIYPTNVTLKAGEVIRFTPGFNATRGANVKAYIDPALKNGVAYLKTTVNPCIEIPCDNVQTSVKNNDQVYLDKNNLEKRDTTKSNLTVYPNPSTGLFNMKIEKIDKNLTVRVLDKNRKIVYEYNSITANNIYIDLRGSLRGLYYLQVISDEDVYNKKLLLY